MTDTNLLLNISHVDTKDYSIDFFLLASPCQLKFQVVTQYEIRLSFGPQLLAMGDFNGDAQLDFAFYSHDSTSITVWLGRSNGTFRTQMMSSVEYNTYVTNIAAADFNHDGQLDLALVDTFVGCVSIFIGNGDGTFQTFVVLSTGTGSDPKEISVADCNGDNCFDVAVINHYTNNVGVFLGYCNGSFSAQTTFYTDRYSSPGSLAVSDFNTDSYLDIAVLSHVNRNIGVLLGYGNRSFQTAKTSFTGGGFSPDNIVVGDFNGDALPDVAVSFRSAHAIGIMFGYGNGSFSAKKKFFIESAGNISPVVVSDFNGDAHMDLAVGHGGLYGLSVLVGDGNGNFDIQTILSTESYTFIPGFAVGDINGDGYQDIVGIKSSFDGVSILLNICEC